MLREYLRHVPGFSPAARLFLVAQFLFGIGQSAVWVLRNLYLKEAGFPIDRIGTTLAASSFGMVVVVALLAPLMDRARLKGFLSCGALMLAGGLAGVALVRHEFAVMGFSFLSGLGLALLEVSTAPFYMRHSKGTERPYLFGVGMALSPAAGLVATLGIKVGAAVGGESLLSYRAMMFVAAGVTAAAAIAILCIREAEPEPARDQEERFDWNTASKFFLPEIVIGLGAGLTIPFINLYFRERFQVLPGNIGLFYAVAQGMMMVAFLAAPVLARRFGAVRTIVAFQLSSIPFFLVMALTMSLPVAVGAFLLRHACMNMVHPVSANFMMSVVRPSQRARINGLKQTANRLSWVVANLTGGFLISETKILIDGFTTTMFITIILYVAGGLMYWRFFRGQREGRAAPGVDLAPEE